MSESLILLLLSQYQDSHWLLLCSFEACMFSAYKMNCYLPRRKARQKVLKYKHLHLKNYLY